MPDAGIGRSSGVVGGAGEVVAQHRRCAVVVVDLGDAAQGVALYTNGAACGISGGCQEAAHVVSGGSRACIGGDLLLGVAQCVSGVAGGDAFEVFGRGDGVQLVVGDRGCVVQRVGDLCDAPKPVTQKIGARVTAHTHRRNIPIAVIDIGCNLRISVSFFF
ncbi:hypothetical protein D3C72_1424880 [compost metagenome]